jgi:NADH-quinone oxidoreductase subunit F
MSARAARILAWTITSSAALGSAGCAVLLTASALHAQSAAPAARVQFDALRQRGIQDPKIGAELHAAYERVTSETLSREPRDRALAWALLDCGVALALGARWLTTLRTRYPAPPASVVARHARALVSGPALSAAQAAASRAAPPTDEPEAAAVVAALVEQHGRGPTAAIPLLHALQEHFRYLPAAALRRICDLTEITPAQLEGVASFYSRFRRRPTGAHVVTVCHGTACHVAGAPLINDELRRRLGIPPGEDTDAARQFTVQAVPCLGCCTLAPVVQVDGTTHGHVRPDTALDLLHTASRNGHACRCAAAARVDPQAPLLGEIRIGLGSCCVANGSEHVHQALQAALADVRARVLVKRVGCVGMCHQTPFLEVRRYNGHAAANGGAVATRTSVSLSPALGAGASSKPGTLYTRVTPEQTHAIIRRHFRPPGLATRTAAQVRRSWQAWRDGPAANPAPPRTIELRDPPVAAFLGRQVHIATEHCGALDPLDLDEYCAHDGFLALRRVLDERRSPETVIAQIRASGLRGRGGAGFPTWRKWAAVRAADGNGPKYVICNGDEGDPGAFMDRMLLESYPYRVIEGLAIAAYAVGAAEVICYIRAEYPLACERMRTAIERCTAAGLLGHALLGRGPACHLRVEQGAGAFVCGEETALIAALEGQRGMPTLRPPYPAERGLHGRPTLVNNVETVAVVPWIVRHGPERFADLGTPTSPGTKVFALTGKVARGGLIEVPMGITIREIVEDIGGGVQADERRPRQFKAVQIGGPSGGCIPAALADTPVDFEALAQLGAIMGSGGLVVLDNTDCMVDMARYFLEFTQDQSCGKCVPCRIGTRRMREILERICAGRGQPRDLAQLETLAHDVGQSSLCGLGRTAPNPVLTTLRHFRAEYEAHLAGHCPAGRCQALIRYEITARCTGCTLCAQHCPVGAIPLTPYERHRIDADKCTRCDVCRVRCPEGAIDVL